MARRRVGRFGGGLDAATGVSRNSRAISSGLAEARCSTVSKRFLRRRLESPQACREPRNACPPRAWALLRAWWTRTTAASKLRCRSRRQASDGATSPAAFSAVEANQGAQQAWPDAANRQALPVVGQIEAHGGNVDHVDIEVVEAGAGGSRDTVKALANDVAGIFGGEQQDTPRSGGEAPQAGCAGRDGDCKAEERFAAFRLSDADRLFAPQLFDEPAPLLRLFGELRGPTGGESIHDRAPLRLSGVKISKNSFSSSSVALGGSGEQTVGHPGEGAVVAGGMIAKGVLQALRHEIRVAGLLEEVVEAGGEFLSFGVGQALANAGLQGLQLVALQLVGKVRIARQHDAENGSNSVAASRRSSPSTAG